MQLLLTMSYPLDDIDKKTKEGATPLAFACSTGKIDAMKFLLERGANKKTRSADGSTLLIQACASDPQNEELVEFLLREGLPVNCEDSDGNSPLIYACSFGHAKIVKLLLRAGAQVNCANKQPCSPLYFVCERGYAEIASMLLDAGANPHNVYVSGKDVLYVACFRGHMDIVRILLTCEQNTNPFFNIQNYLNSSLFGYLSAAVISGNEELVEFLITLGANIDQVSAETLLTPLAVSCREHKKRMIKILIEAGADVNKKHTRDGKLPLTFAFSKKLDPDIVDLLLNAGADPVPAGLQEFVKLHFLQRFLKTMCFGTHCANSPLFAASGLSANHCIYLRQIATPTTAARFNRTTLSIHAHFFLLFSLAFACHSD